MTFREVEEDHEVRKWSARPPASAAQLPVFVPDWPCDVKGYEDKGADKGKDKNKHGTGKGYEDKGEDKGKGKSQNDKGTGPKN